LGTTVPLRPEISQSPVPWPVRDLFVAIALFLATTGFVLWQNSQVAVLWDLSYLLDTSYRISLGQMPYRDFPLVHPPLTFLIQAVLMRFAGRVYPLQIAYAALVGGLGSVIAWRILLSTLRERVQHAWTVSLLLAAPLSVVGIYSIYPHPIYDCDCTFAILVAVFLLQRFGPNEVSGSSVLRKWVRPALTGAAVVLPVFFKQNMGLPFLLAVVAGVLSLLAARLLGVTKRSIAFDRPDTADLLRLLATITAVFLAALALIQLLAGLGNYLHWTVRFAGERRLPGFADMLAVYHQPAFLWTLPTLAAGLLLLHSRYASKLWGEILGICLVSAPFLGSIVFLFLNDDLDERGDNLLALWPLLLLVSAFFAIAQLRKGITLARLMPFFVLAAIHGTFLSQQLWGSTYAIWPLLMVLVAQILTSIPQTSRLSALTLATAISATFLVCGSFYAVGHERLNYIQIPDTPLSRATLPALRGIADRGPFLPDFEELVRFADKEIPVQDGLLLLPGEDPFYFATGRAPQFPVLLLDRTTDPYSPEELLATARSHDTQWVIVKRRLQLNDDPLPQRERVMALVASEFTLYRKLNGYDVYRRL